MQKLHQGVKTLLPSWQNQLLLLFQQRGSTKLFFQSSNSSRYFFSLNQQRRGIQWRSMKVEQMMDAINKDLGDENGFDPELVQDTITKLKKFAKVTALLENYSVEKLEDKGVETSVATAIMDFITKHKSSAAGGIAPRVATFEDKVALLENLIDAETPPNTKPRFLFKEFVHREQAKKTAITAAMNNYEAFEKNIKGGTKKQDHSFIIIPGGSGSGKTRAACEVGNTLREAAKRGELEAFFAFTQEIYIEFDNGNAISLIDESLNPGDVLGLRLFLKAFRNETTSSTSLDKKVLSDLSKQGLFDVDIVLHVIGKWYRRWLHMERCAPLPIVIILDEYQRTMDGPLGSDKRWKLIAKSLGNFMCETSGPNTRLNRDHLVLIPVLSGTVVKDISFELTEYNNQLTELPLFPFPVIQKLTIQEGLPSQVLTGREKTRFWLLMGLVPRSLEYAVETTRQLLQKPQFEKLSLVGYNDIQFTEALFTAVEDLLRTKYKISPGQYYTGFENLDEILFSMAAIGVPADSHISWITSLEKQGQLYFDSIRGRVFLPYIVFKSLRDRFSSQLPKALLPELSSTFTWRMFEMLDPTLLALRINYYHTHLERHTVSVRDLWPGAYCGDALSGLQLRVQQVTFANETTPYIIGKTKNSREIKIVCDSPMMIDTQPNHPIPASKLRNYVLHAMEGHPRTDARWFTETINGDPVLVVFQYKYMSEPSRPNTREDSMKEGPGTWYESIIPHLETAYSEYSVIGVYITNGNIPKKAQEAVTKYKGNLVVIDNSVAEFYFAPNILPYIQTMEPPLSPPPPSIEQDNSSK